MIQIKSQRYTPLSIQMKHLETVVGKATLSLQFRSHPQFGLAGDRKHAEATMTALVVDKENGLLYMEVTYKMLVTLESEIKNERELKVLQGKMYSELYPKCKRWLVMMLEECISNPDVIAKLLPPANIFSTKAE